MPKGRARAPRAPSASKIPHSKAYSPKTPTRAEVEQLPSPEALGVGSTDEARAYMILKRFGIPFSIQVNFDGGADVYGGQRADFVLYDRWVIIEILGPWHDQPDQQIKDARKWERRRQEGWTVVGVRTDAFDFEDQVLRAAGRRI